MSEYQLLGHSALEFIQKYYDQCEVHILDYFFCVVFWKKKLCNGYSYTVALINKKMTLMLNHKCSCASREIT